MTTPSLAPTVRRIESTRLRVMLLTISTTHLAVLLEYPLHYDSQFGLDILSLCPIEADILADILYQLPRDVPERCVA